MLSPIRWPPSRTGSARMPGIRLRENHIPSFRQPKNRGALRFHRIPRRLPSTHWIHDDAEPQPSASARSPDVPDHRKAVQTAGRRRKGILIRWNPRLIPSTSAPSSSAEKSPAASGASITGIRNLSSFISLLCILSSSFRRVSGFVFLDNVLRPSCFTQAATAIWLIMFHCLAGMVRMLYPAASSSVARS